MKYLVLLAFLLFGCGGGDAPTTISFYGDSLTAGHVQDVVQGDFIGVDYAVGGQLSFVPLNPDDRAPVAVIRYGMADAWFKVAPEQTRANVGKMVDQIRARGGYPIVVNVSQTPTGFEKATNAALKDITDIDVSCIEGNTLDGIHPDDEFYRALNQQIHDGLIVLDRYRISVASTSPASRGFFLGCR